MTARVVDTPPDLKLDRLRAQLNRYRASRTSVSVVSRHREAVVACAFGRYSEPLVTSARILWPYSEDW